MNKNNLQYQIQDKVDNDLPEGWCWTALSDIVKNPISDIVDGPFGSDLKVSEYIDEGIPIIRLQNVERNRFIDKNIRFISPHKAKELKRHDFNPGDIVITKLGDPLGKACVVPRNFGPGIVVADIVRLRLNDELCSIPYLAYSINSDIVIEQLLQHIKGTTRPRVNLGNIRSLKIPLPPVAEQRRIIDKLGQLLARVYSTKDRVAKVSLILKRFRQAVLSAVCSGRLTADWREDNEKDSAKDFLLKILSHRRSLVETKGKVSFRACYKEPIKPAYQFELEIPDTWCLATVDQLTLLVTKGSSPKWQGFEYTEFGLPFVRSQNVLWGNLDLSNVAYLPLVFNESHKNSIIHQGDILLNLVGASVGRSSIATEAIEGANCNQAVAIIRLVPDGILNKFLMYFFLSPYAQEHIHESKADVARANFNLDDIRPMVVPVPPLAEQNEIVRRVEAMFKLADAVEKRLAVAAVRAEKLTQAILAKAFRGELVPTEAELARRESRSYESALELLAKIKSNR
jgi:type I restriction enzyme S subunit